MPCHGRCRGGHSVRGCEDRLRWRDAPGGRRRMPERGRRVGRWLTTAQWFALTFAGITLLLAAGAVLGARTLDQTGTVSDRLSDRISPARTYAAQLQAALSDQETGIRGYLLTADTDFLAPYTSGLDAQADASRQ